MYIYIYQSLALSVIINFVFISKAKGLLSKKKVKGLVWSFQL